MTGALSIADQIELKTDGSALFAGGDLEIFDTGAASNSQADNSGY